MFSVEHASSTGPAAMEEGRREGGGGVGEQQAFCSVAKQAVEFPQVLASFYNYSTKGKLFSDLMIYGS